MADVCISIEKTSTLTQVMVCKQTGANKFPDPMHVDKDLRHEATVG